MVYQFYKESYKDDYKHYILGTSNGFTQIKIWYINQSLESYLYSILGAQARTKQSIFCKRASVLETQLQFHQLVEDRVLNFDTSTSINNMNQAITDTNVVVHNV